MAKRITTIKDKKIVCLGGGIGTVNLVKGLKAYTKDISVIVSMADDGGSAGRLRRLYNIMPPGDVASCMAALMDQSDETMSQLLTYRFPGERYGKDADLPGQKLGNLMMAAATEITGSFIEAIALLKKLFKVTEAIIPATSLPVSISAKTVDGREIEGEENIDLGKFRGETPLESVMLHPHDIKASPEALDALAAADIVIVGPGDLYTTILPSIIIPEIKSFLLTTDKPKVFITNVANKPFETKGYSVGDFVTAIKKHLGEFPFQTVVANNELSLPLPENLEFNYTYVHLAADEKNDYELITASLVATDFPLYHDSAKLAKLLDTGI